MDMIAFARGVPAPEMLPVDDLRTAAARAFDSDPVGILSYGTGAGWPALRERLARQHDVEPECVVVTSGSLQGMWLLLQVLAEQAAREGRRARVIVESPTYDRPLLLLDRLGMEVIPVPVDESGVDAVALDAAMAAGADLAYLIPTFQNPAGTTLVQERRTAVVESARRHGVLVLEDDPYGQLHFETPAPASLFEQRGAAPIAYSGSFSKTIAPGLRVGWLVLPRALAEDVSKLANDTYISSSFLGQATVEAFLAAGSLEPTLERVRGQLHARCRAIEAALRHHLPDARFVSPGGGYFIWVELPHGLAAADVARHAGAVGVSFVDGASCSSSCSGFVRLAFSSPGIEQIEPGIERLAAACNMARAGSTVPG